MAKRGRPAKVTKTVEEFPAARGAEAEAAAPTPPDVGSDEFAGAFPNGKVTVWERVRDKADALVGTFEADGDVQARVAALVGGGEYVWRLRLPTGYWASKEKDGVTGQGKFTISERAFPKKSAVAQGNPPVAAAPVQGEAGLNMQALFMAQMQQTTALLTALVGRQPPDPLSMIGAIKALLPEPPPPTNPLENIATTMELMKNAQDLAGGRGGGGGGGKMEDRIFGLLEAVAPTVASRMMAPAVAAPRTAPQAAPRPAPQLAGAPVAEVQPPPAANPPAGDDDVNLRQMAQFAMISGYIPTLADLAQRGRDAVTYADVFLDEAEKRNIPSHQMVEFFGNKNLVRELGEKFPQVKANADWFETFREAVSSMLTAPPEGDTLSGDVEAPGAAAPVENSDA